MAHQYERYSPLKYVSRPEEEKKLLGWVKDPSSAYQTLILTGGAGLGKTWFVHHTAKQIEKVQYIDVIGLAAVGADAPDFLHAQLDKIAALYNVSLPETSSQSRRKLSLRKRAEYLVSVLKEAAPSAPVAIIVDHIDPQPMYPLKQKELVDSFFSPLLESVSVRGVLVGRAFKNVWKAAHQPTPANELELPGFTQEQAIEQFKKLFAASGK